MRPASTPPPPYTAVIFTSVRTDTDDAGYGETAEAMERLAAEQPGYLGIETARDALGITVSYWASAEHARAWKAVAEHRLAQQRGRETWYRTYRVRVATVEREYGSAE
jgi:heme-degrading monooxygenase HmoA